MTDLPENLRVIRDEAAKGMCCSCQKDDCEVCKGEIANGYWRFIRGFNKCYEVMAEERGFAQSLIRLADEKIELKQQLAEKDQLLEECVAAFEHISNGQEYYTLANEMLTKLKGGSDE